VETSQFKIYISIFHKVNLLYFSMIAYPYDFMFFVIENPKTF